MANGSEFVRYTRSHLAKLLRDAMASGKQQGRLEALSVEWQRFDDEHLKGTLKRLQVMSHGFSGEARATVNDALILLTAQRLTIQLHATVQAFAQEQFERVKRERDELKQQIEIATSVATLPRRD